MAHPERAWRSRCRRPPRAFLRGSLWCRGEELRAETAGTPTNTTTLRMATAGATTGRLARPTSASGVAVASSGGPRPPVNGDSRRNRESANGWLATLGNASAASTHPALTPSRPAEAMAVAGAVVRTSGADGPGFAAFGAIDPPAGACQRRHQRRRTGGADAQAGTRKSCCRLPAGTRATPTIVTCSMAFARPKRRGTSLACPPVICLFRGTRVPLWGPIGWPGSWWEWLTRSPGLGDAVSHEPASTELAVPLQGQALQFIRTTLHLPHRAELAGVLVPLYSYCAGNQ